MSDPQTLRRIADLEAALAALQTRERPATGGARVYNSVNISISTGAVTVLTFDSERYDDASYHSTSSNTSRLTAPTAGRYHIGTNIRWATNATGRRQLRLTLNGATEIARQTAASAGAGGQTDQQIGCDYELAAGDYVEVFVFQDSGGALNVEAAANFSPEFWIHRL